MNCYNRNLKALENKQPEVAEKISRLTIDADYPNIFNAKDGNKTIEITLPDGRKSLLHSAYSPLKEAKRLVDSYNLSPTSNLLFLGSGLGYQIIDTLRRRSDRDFILVVEKNPKILHAFLSSMDVSQAIESGQVKFAVDEKPKSIFRYLQQYAFTILENSVTAVKHPPSFKIAEDYYNSVIRILSELLIWAKVNTNSQIHNGRKYVVNLFENIHQLFQAEGVSALKNSYCQKPAIIVSAGPSLTKNISQLRFAQGKAVIISVDTALRALINSGIYPDFVVSIDFTSHNQRYFEGIDTGNLKLITDLEVYPQILRNFSGKKYLMNLPGKSLCEWFALILGDFGTLEKGLSVAHSAFLLAHYMGCDPIIFTGQDLAYSEGLSHVKGTAMARREPVSNQQENMIPVTDIFGGRILTHVSMHVFLKHFEELIHTYSKQRNFKCIDATEGGALIEGATPMPLRETVLQFCNQKFNIDEFISGTGNITLNSMAGELLTECKKIVSRLDRLAKTCKGGEALMKKIAKEFSSSISGQVHISSLRKGMEILNRTLKEHEKELNALKDITVEEMVLQVKKMPVEPDNTAILDYIDRSKRFYAGLANAAGFLYRKFQSLSEELADSDSSCKGQFFYNETFTH